MKNNIDNNAAEASSMGAPAVAAHKNGPVNARISQALAFICVFCIIASLALVRDHKLFGIDFTPKDESATSTITISGNQRIINTSSLVQDVSGYAGPVPVNIYISDSRIDSIRPLPNDETPGFFNTLYENGLITHWDGMDVDKALNSKVDAVSGATYSSTAYIQNVRKGLAYDLKTNPAKQVPPSEGISVKKIFVLIVLAMAAILPLFIKNRKYHFIQQLLNVGILGFWGGTFLDFAMITGYFANGASFSVASIITVALFIIGFVYPLLGKHSYYCAHVCPLGSLQDLAGLCSKREIHMAPWLTKALGQLREVLWVTLLILLWTGSWTVWFDHELFTAFIVESASWWVIGTGIFIVLLSIFIPRPFCRFVCPTGTLLRKSQSLESD